MNIKYLHPELETTRVAINITGDGNIQQHLAELDILISEYPSGNCAVNFYTRRRGYRQKHIPHRANILFDDALLPAIEKLNSKHTVFRVMSHKYDSKIKDMKSHMAKLDAMFEKAKENLKK